MRTVTLLSLLLAAAVSCTSVPRYKFDYQDIGFLKEGFVEVVHKHYSHRKDGVLSGPTFVIEQDALGGIYANGQSMRFTFHYHEPVITVLDLGRRTLREDSEIIDLLFGVVSIQRVPGMVTEAPIGFDHKFQVLVFRASSNVVHGSGTKLIKQSIRLAEDMRALVRNGR